AMPYSRRESAALKAMIYLHLGTVHRYRRLGLDWCAGLATHYAPRAPYPTTRLSRRVLRDHAAEAVAEADEHHGARGDRYSPDARFHLPTEPSSRRPWLPIGRASIRQLQMAEVFDAT